MYGTSQGKREKESWSQYVFLGLARERRDLTGRERDGTFRAAYPLAKAIG
jgi:hypothetical protein